jgi:DNA primase small subunit
MNPAAEFVRKKFREYYQKKGVIAPEGIEKREFGFGNDKKIDYRHLSFTKEEELKNYFVTNSPLYASFSSAYYEFPSAQPMPKKNILAADLIFEFDAECHHDSLTCSECLEKAKQNTQRLIDDFLIPDFGFDKKDIKITFSGSRGYHLYVVNEEVKHLNAEARRAIVDYLQAKNLDIKSIIRGGATLKSKGWRGRLAKAAHDYVRVSSEKKFTEKEEILRKMAEGNYDLFRGAHSFWDKMLNEQVVYLGSAIDQSVTIDISRLIRLPSTLHGGSSLLCKYVDNLDKFNPFSDTVVFYNPPMKIKFTKDVSEMVLKEQTLGPFKAGEEKNVPEYAALYLICKEVALPSIL